MDEQTKRDEYNKAINNEIAKFDINPFVIDDEKRVLLAKRISNVQYGNHWHMPGGKVFVNERMVDSLKRMTKLKTGLDIALYFENFNDNVTGVYDDPARDPREHVIGITFLCRVIGGDIQIGGNCSEVSFVKEDDALELDLAFGHDYMLKDGFNFIRMKGI